MEKDTVLEFHNAIYTGDLKYAERALKIEPRLVHSVLDGLAPVHHAISNYDPATIDLLIRAERETGLDAPSIAFQKVESPNENHPHKYNNKTALEMAMAESKRSGTVIDRKPNGESKESERSEVFHPIIEKLADYQHEVLDRLLVDVKDNGLYSGGDVRFGIAQSARNSLLSGIVSGKRSVDDTAISVLQNHETGEARYLPGKAGLTPLHVAALAGNRDLYAALMDNGADQSVRDVNGLTPVDIAQLRGDKRVLEVAQAAIELASEPQQAAPGKFASGVLDSRRQAAAHGSER